MKNTLPMNLRVFALGYRIMMSKPVRWAGGVVAGVITSCLLVVVGMPAMVLVSVVGAVWMLYMSVFDQAGIKRWADQAEARRLREGVSDDELRD